MLNKAKEGLKNALHHLDLEFSRIQMWVANPLLVEDIMVEQYGSFQPLKNVASVSVMDPQTLSIKPWDKTVINDIAKAMSKVSKMRKTYNYNKLKKFLKFKNSDNYTKKLIFYLLK